MFVSHCKKTNPYFTKYLFKSLIAVQPGNGYRTEPIDGLEHFVQSNFEP